MRKLLDKLISAINRWIDRELEAAKRDSDVSYAEYKELQKMVSQQRSELPKQKDTP